jgi:hypothetical protein
MKKTLYAAIALASAITLTGCDKGSVFNAPQAHTDYTSRIESAGWDMRVYEFTPQTSPNTQCVMVVGTQLGGLDCFPKEKTHE